jgi:hypothetical protein
MIPLRIAAGRASAQCLSGRWPVRFAEMLFVGAVIKDIVVQALSEGMRGRRFFGLSGVISGWLLPVFVRWRFV